MRLCQGRRLATTATVWLVAALVGRAGAATPPVQVEGLRVGYADRERHNLFKIGTWTPVWVWLRAGSAGFAGSLELIAPDDGGAPSAFRVPVDLPAGESRRFTTYARPGTRDPEFTVRLLDREGRRAVADATTGSSGGARAALNPIPADDFLLVTLGKPKGVDKIPGLTGFMASRNMASSGDAPGNAVAVAAFDDLEGGLPEDWFAYDGASVVVLDTADPAVMAMSAASARALKGWVERGGHLVVSVGAEWKRAKDGFLGPMLPGVPTGLERVPSLESLDSFAGAVKQITPPGTAAVMVVKFEQVEARGGKALATTGDLPLVVRGPCGFGRVTAVAIDVDRSPFADWPDQALFWVRALDLRRQSAEPTAGPSPAMGGGRFARAADRDLASRLHKALGRFPGVRLVPFGWVAFFILLYILVIGPGDYLFLKKVLRGRMELTWVTFPLVVATVSGLAYYAAYRAKGTELRVNKLDVVDIDQTSGLTRGTSLLNVFSPRNGDYSMTVAEMRVKKVKSEDLLSWFGDPEPGFGGMGQSGRIGFSAGGYDYEPSGGASTLAGVRIPIWSAKALTVRWFGTSGPVLESDLYPTGLDRLAGTVTNTLPFPLRDALLAYGRQVYILGTVPPNATVRVELAQDRFLSGLLKATAARYNMPDANDDPVRSAALRADLALALMFHDSESTVASEASLTNATLQHLDLTGQLQLGRPMLVARIDARTSKLVISGPFGAVDAPKLEETTMLRVILPLKPAQPELIREAR